MTTQLDFATLALFVCAFLMAALMPIAIVVPIDSKVYKAIPFALAGLFTLCLVFVALILFFMATNSG
mgnify:CR=1 FL=1